MLVIWRLIHDPRRCNECSRPPRSPPDPQAQDRHRLQIALGHAGTWAYRLGFRRLDLEQAADGYSLRLMRARGYNVKDVPWLFARLMARSSGKARRELTVRRAAIMNAIEGETT